MKNMQYNCTDPSSEQTGRDIARLFLKKQDKTNIFSFFGWVMVMIFTVIVVALKIIIWEIVVVRWLLLCIIGHTFRISNQLFT